jgi:two-component system OmpR family response regulator
MAGTMPHVLLVDDDPTLHDLLTILLTPEGCTLTCVGTARAARARLEEGGIDLLLLDLNLPDENGLALCSELRATWWKQDLPIVVLSGLSDPDWLARACYAGADEYLVKPFDANELLATIRRLCGGEPLSERAAS